MKKLEALPGWAQAQPPGADTRIVILVKLNPGAERPDFLTPRAEIAPGLFSAEVMARDLERIEHDPAVCSISLSRSLPMIE